MSLRGRPEEALVGLGLRGCARCPYNVQVLPTPGVVKWPNDVPPSALAPPTAVKLTAIPSFASIEVRLPAAAATRLGNCRCANECARALGSAPQESVLSDNAYYLKCIGGLLVGASGTWRVEKTGSKASVIESLGFRSVVASWRLPLLFGTTGGNLPFCVLEHRCAMPHCPACADSSVLTICG